MEIEDRVADLSSLADKVVFEQLYSTVVTEMASVHSMTPVIAPDALSAAFDDWRDAYHRTLPKHYSDYRRLVVLIKLITQSLVSKKIVTFRSQSAPRSNVVDLQVGILIRYPNEIAGLTVGGICYALAMQRLTNLEPELVLSPAELEQAAEILSKRPSKAKSFRTLLKLSIFRPLFDADK